MKCIGWPIGKSGESNCPLDAEVDKTRSDFLCSVCDEARLGFIDSRMVACLDSFNKERP